MLPAVFIRAIVLIEIFWT